ncbi:sulfurtransferase complex subunit TusC [Methylomonas sp. 2BW1-5-20]|uniref:sulfurtransferase complex subunit TusC n=1 Tax=Methylomonas sp. 2BW1-5-20 TaxID=3376686 RepID=UPI00405331F0
MKRYLFIMRRPPHCGSHLQETLDVILTAAAFDQQVALLFADEAVLQLKTHQGADGMALKDTLAIFKALQIYDVNDLYVEQESLHAAGLDTDNLILPVSILPRREIKHLMRGYDVIVPD